MATAATAIRNPTAAARGGGMRQHFARSAADLATDVTLRFLGHLGLIDTPASARGARGACWKCTW